MAEKDIIKDLLDKRETKNREPKFEEGDTVSISDPHSPDFGRKGKVVKVNEDLSAPLTVQFKDGETVNISEDLLESNSSGMDRSGDIFEEFKQGL